LQNDANNEGQSLNQADPGGNFTVGLVLDC